MTALIWIGFFAFLVAVLYMFYRIGTKSYRWVDQPLHVEVISPPEPLPPFDTIYGIHNSPEYKQEET